MFVQLKLPCRWLKTCQTVQCVAPTFAEEQHIDFRRMQVHEQQAERQKRNILQKCMVFAAHADYLTFKDPKGALKQSCIYRVFQPVTISYLLVGSSQEKDKYKDDWKAAFMKAIENYNGYYLASTSAKFQIDDATAHSLYGFKVGIPQKNIYVLLQITMLHQIVTFEVGVADETWKLLQRHLHQHRFENSGHVTCNVKNDCQGLNFIMFYPYQVQLNKKICLFDVC